MDENHLNKALSLTAAKPRRITADEMRAIEAVFADGAEEISPAIRMIPLLGEVPAGRFQPADQKGGRRVVAPDPDTPARAYALTVKGDSMDLIVPDGAVLVIDPDDTTLWPGRRYVVRTEDGETTFKEYQDGPARLVPCSSNSVHVEIMLGSEPLSILGRVFSYSMRDVPRRIA